MTFKSITCGRASEIQRYADATNTYGVDIVPGANDILIHAITVIIDMMID